MADLPKIVRERLQAAPAGVHPDADQLTAFAEKRLGERERAQVLAHLSACQACREVVSLALPEKAEAEAAAAPRPAPGWGLRWQTLAAMAMVAVAAAALLVIPNSYFRPGRSVTTQVAQAPTPAPAGTAAATREEYGRAQQTAPEASTADGKPAAKTASGPAPATGNRGAGIGGGAAAGTISADLAKAEKDRQDKDKVAMDRALPSAPQKKEDQVQALVPPPPAASGQPATPPSQDAYEFKGSKAAPAADQAAAQGGEKQDGVVGGLAETPGAQKVQTEARKAPVTTQANATEQPVPQTSTTVEVAAEAVTMQMGPAWRTTTAGRLQRSRDAGQSWRTVTVAAGTVLNAVSAVGEHVWAGGHQQRTAVLYYSADNGAHWARLEFSGPAGAQAADVVALNFSDAQHGVMTVVAAEDSRLRQIWTTADGGRTWTAPPTH
jgi:hypothetical protein